MEGYCLVGAWFLGWSLGGVFWAMVGAGVQLTGADAKDDKGILGERLGDGWIERDGIRW